MVSLEEFNRANERGDELSKGPRATGARYDRRTGRVVVSLSTGIEIAFPPHAAQGLEASSAGDLKTIEISPSGLGLHFPSLDADLYLPALLEGFFGSAHWAAARLGSVGGTAKTEAKTLASRENGRRGGRPRKQPA